MFVNPPVFQRNHTHSDHAVPITINHNTALTRVPYRQPFAERNRSASTFIGSTTISSPPLDSQSSISSDNKLTSHGYIAFNVRAPTIPSAVRWWTAWNHLTFAAVFGPYAPSTANI